ncbi:hypothetical protein MJO28_007027 [Puccinia striiformis f. sp. tritici]|uniref:Uncharacterized protein n=1 Tax=Puccinia striiformis f. sp. tritici TaxID=168172 RepID=A0ACC0EEH8_9BASI|nr:hypothetical protein MJO28_007027 [Puccinia striiformis f. sp. tritici]
MSEDSGDHREPATKTRRQQPRFLGDDEMEDTLDPGPSHSRLDHPQWETDSVDKYFQDLEGADDDDLALPAMLDHEAIEAALEAKKISTAAAAAADLDPFALISGDQPAKRKTNRRPIVKIDEDRLIDPKFGIPHLISLSQKFKPSGKGKEKEDLKRLIKLYRLWTHSMYPKGTFEDTIGTVEKLCHKRKMKDALRRWRDESSSAKPAKKKIKPDDSTTEVIDKEVTGGPESLITRTEAVNDVLNGIIDSLEPQTEEEGSNRPLFRPIDEEESDIEFPVDDDLCTFLDTVEDPSATTATTSAPPVDITTSTASVIGKKTQVDWMEDEDQFAEEEALLREAEAIDSI